MKIGYGKWVNIRIERAQTLKTLDQQLHSKIVHFKKEDNLLQRIIRVVTRHWHELNSMTSPVSRPCLRVMDDLVAGKLLDMECACFLLRSLAWLRHAMQMDSASFVFSAVVCHIDRSGWSCNLLCTESVTSH